MPQRSHQAILFLCTGNYYRSRFAEILFNALAGKKGLAWRASSRGLALERGVHNVGPMAVSAIRALEALSLGAAEDAARSPLPATADDFARANRIIALQETEHRPLLQERFPSWIDKVEYWDVDDAPGALALIEREVADLAASLAILSVVEMQRCPWAAAEPNVQYHDAEWGVPVHDDRRLFEFLILEGAQAGLSWETILKKRDAYRAAFDHFDPAVVARYSEKKRLALLADPGIVRNRLKVESAVVNARAFLAVQKEFGAFDRYVWDFVGGRPRQNAWKSRTDVPARTTESDALSKDLKQRGFKFVGSTICYAFMQAVGMVNDHLVGCFRHAELSSPRNGRD